MALRHWADGLDMATKRLILDRELEELTGRRHVVPQPKTEAKHGAVPGRGRQVIADRWRMLIDPRWPSPIAIARPQSSDGATSFHMRVTTYSRPAEGSAGTTTSSSGGGQGAVAFDVYVTDSRASGLDGARFDRYAADTASPHDPDVEHGTRVAFLVTNIDHDPEKRTAFWETRQEAARKRGEHAIELVPQRGSIDQWRVLQHDADIPSRVRDAISGVVAALESSRLDAHRGKPIAKRRIRLENASEIRWAEGLGTRFGEDKKQRMLHHVRPRGGQIQHRFDAEIPAGLDLAGKLGIARDLAALVTRLKLPFLIAVHRPDTDNDMRNWHLHLLYFPQPGERGPYGIWTFGNAGDGCGMLRPGDIARGLKGDDSIAQGAWYKLGAAADLRALREGYASICNAVLTKAGDARRLDARGFAELGIDKRPERHLGSAKARLFFAGIDTATSRINATRNWEWVIGQRLAEVERSCARLTAPLDALGKTADTDEGVRRERQRLVADHDAILEDRRALVLADIRLEIARSTARRVKENCERTLERIAAGDADRHDVRSEKAIRARLHLVEHHLVEIADAVEPWLGEMQAFRRDLERREQGLRDAVHDCVERANSLVRANTIMARIRDTAMVHIVGYGVDARADVVSLATDEQAVLDHPDVKASVQRELMEMARIQQQEMGRVLAAVRANGMNTTRNATRGKTSTPRADAVLFARYRTHPFLVARLARADAEWSRNAIDEMEAISGRVADMLPPQAMARTEAAGVSKADRMILPTSTPLPSLSGTDVTDAPGHGTMPIPEAPATAPYVAAAEPPEVRDEPVAILARVTDFGPRVGSASLDPDEPIPATAVVDPVTSAMPPEPADIALPVASPDAAHVSLEEPGSDRSGPVIAHPNHATPSQAIIEDREVPPDVEGGARTGGDAIVVGRDVALEPLPAEAIATDERQATVDQDDAAPALSAAPTEAGPDKNAAVAKPPILPLPGLAHALPKTDAPSIPSPATDEGSEQPLTRKSQMAVAREAALSRKGKAVTRNRPKTPAARDVRETAPYRSSEPTDRRPTVKPPVPEDGQEWFEQQMQWNRDKGPGRR